MKKFYVSLALVLLFALTACMPGVVYDPAGGARAFTMIVEGQAIGAQGSTFTYRSNDFDIDFELLQDRIRFVLVNNTTSTMRLVWDNSAIVLPDGSSSRVLSGNVSWATRNDPQAPGVIPSNAKLSDTMIPQSKLGFRTHLYIDPMFTWPLQTRTVIRLVISLEIEGERRDLEVQFVGQPS